jgi:cell division septation protein DedD
MIRGAALLLLALLPAAALASVDEGVAKWRAGDWDGAVAQWVTPAARGDADALFNMGQAYRLGRGVPLNRITAIDYYRRAADKGHAAAAANLGITLWQEGRKTDALTSLRAAAEKGDLRASYVLGVATFEGDTAPRNPALGYAYVVRARDGGLSLASAQAARMATRMSSDDRAKGEAAAQALAEGRPVTVVLAAMSAPLPAPEPAVADEGVDSVEEALAESAAPAKADQPRKTESAKPAPAKAEARAEPPAEGWKVQLGAYANERTARTAWATLVSQSAALLKGKKPLYAPRGGLVRLQVGPFEERAPAAELCAKLSAAGRPCFVTK